MKNKSLFILIALATLISSCQEVIDLKLNTSSSQIVIQGNLDDLEGPDTIKISRSVDFDEASIFPAVTGATVTISSNVGDTAILTEISEGIYVTDPSPGIAGRTYTLNVLTEGKTYTANSTMPNAVSIDSIYFGKSLFSNEKIITIDFKDPAKSTNFYRFIPFINNDKINQFNVMDDKYINGKDFSYPFYRMRMNNDLSLKSGSTVQIWLESIDEGVYNYFRTAGSDGRNSASPANPNTNLTNGALGYFNACSIRKITTIVP